MLRYRSQILLAILSQWAGVLSAQLPTAAGFEREFHDHVLEILRAAQISPLPAGDTLVNWAKKGPVLYHTINLRPHRVQSSLVRNDPFAEVLMTSWADNRPDSFVVVYRRNDSTIAKLRGRRRGSTLLIAGSRSAAMPVPDSLWAIADYGMDEHLIPLLLMLRRDGSFHRIQVLRPFPFHWDTVTVSARTAPQTIALVIYSGEQHETHMLVTTSGRLLSSRHIDGSSEQRPLELTPLATLYRLVTGRAPNE